MDIKRLAINISGATIHADKLAGAVESLALAVVTRAATWVAAIPTIILTSRTCQVVFGLGWTEALLSAIALEVIGAAVTNTWLNAREWNRTKRKTDPVANERLALAATVAYFVTDFILVGVLEVPKALVNPVHWAALLFPLGQVISTLMVSERAAQFRRETEVTQDKAERAQKRAQRRAQKRAQKHAQELAQSVHKSAHKDNGRSVEKGTQGGDLDAVNRTRQERKDKLMGTLVDAYVGNPDLGVTDAARLLNVHRNTVYNYLSELESQGVIRRNGKGVEVLIEL